MVSPKKLRYDKLNTKQFFIYHFYDFMFFTDLDNTFTRSRALGWLFDPALQLFIMNCSNLTKPLIRLSTVNN